MTVTHMRYVCIQFLIYTAENLQHLATLIRNPVLFHGDEITDLGCNAAKWLASGICISNKGSKHFSSHYFKMLSINDSRKCGRSQL